MCAVLTFAPLERLHHVDVCVLSSLCCLAFVWSTCVFLICLCLFRVVDVRILDLSSFVCLVDVCILDLSLSCIRVVDVRVLDLSLFVSVAVRCTVLYCTVLCRCTSGARHSYCFGILSCSRVDACMFPLSFVTHVSACCRDVELE